MRVFATKIFMRFARKERLDEKRLCEAITGAKRGLIDVELGGGLIKQRSRVSTIWLCQERARKHRRSGMDDLKKHAKHYLGYGDAQIATALAEADLREVACDGQEA